MGDDQQRPSPYEGIKPLSAPHDPEVADDPDDTPREADEIEDLEAATGLLEIDPLDPIKRRQRPGEPHPGLDPTLPPIPPS